MHNVFDTNTISLQLKHGYCFSGVCAVLYHKRELHHKCQITATPLCAGLLGVGLQLSKIIKKILLYESSFHMPFDAYTNAVWNSSKYNAGFDFR